MIQKQHLDASDITEKLLNEMKTGMYKEESKLPPESILAEKMGISRTLLRDCLSLLEREGFISRRQGIGTVINRHVLNVTTRMDLEMEFLDMIEQAGLEPSVSLTEISTVFCDAVMAQKLGVQEQTPVLKVARIINADGKPAIYCSDHISFQIIKNYNYKQSDLEKPIFYFLQKFCDIEVFMDLTVVNPVIADEKLAKVFVTKEGVPLLNMDEVGYDIDGKPVLWSMEYYANNVLQQTVLRKKI